MLPARVRQPRSGRAAGQRLWAHRLRERAELADGTVLLLFGAMDFYMDIGKYYDIAQDTAIQW